MYVSFQKVKITKASKLLTKALSHESQCSGRQSNKYIKLLIYIGLYVFIKKIPSNMPLKFNLTNLSHGHF
jgi:hypothetical protein